MDIRAERLRAAQSRAAQLAAEIEDEEDAPLHPVVRAALKSELEIILACGVDGKPIYPAAARNRSARTLLEFFAPKPAVRKMLEIVRSNGKAPVTL